MYRKGSQGIWAEGSSEARNYQKSTLLSSAEPDFTNAAFWKWLGPPAVCQASLPNVDCTPHRRRF